jgi:hypothetical protein
MPSGPARHGVLPGGLESHRALRSPFLGSGLGLAMRFGACCLTIVRTRARGHAGAHAERTAGSALLTVAAIRTAVTGFESAGCDMLIMSPAVADPSQVELLADAVHHR